jgi:predicted 3-demethylubiquinone-9 3-methyltransferase (glyoxalase superfamily)
MPKITPFLWFDDKAEEAAKFYTSIFKNSKITGIARYLEGSPGPAGTVMTVGFGWAPVHGSQRRPDFQLH